MILNQFLPFLSRVKFGLEYLSRLLSDPSDVIGQDVLRVLLTTKQIGTIPAQVEIYELRSLIKDKKSLLKDVKDAAVKNSITELIGNLKKASKFLTNIPSDTGKLISETVKLPSKPTKEMSGWQGAVGLALVLTKIELAKTNLDTVQTEAPKLASNVIEMIQILEDVLQSLG